MPARPLVRLSAAALVVLTAATVAGVAASGVAAADAGSDQTLLSATNTARAQHGLRRYAEAADLVAQAQQWAAWMARHRTLAHNPALGSQACCWSDLGENVGRGGSAAAVQRGFMQSPSHRANILSAAFTQVGIGTARGGDGRVYVDEVFRRPAQAPAAAPAPHRAPARHVSRSLRRVSRASGVRAPGLGRSGTAAGRAGSTRLRAWLHRVAWLDRAAAHPDPVRRAMLYATALRAVPA